ncbi:MAG TPA: PQQ-binding-like beta-propeller repeat protein [Urbifossiella sp.]|nr:PQQ-binding-like beta-propeller repeat protein [Urbifossiella sp.]
MRPPVAAVLVAAMLASASAADWPMGGRTPGRRQVGSPDAKPRNVKWTATVGSRALGGPVVAGGLVWVGTNNWFDDPDAPDFAVLACFRESDGKLLYRYQSPRVRHRVVGQEQHGHCRSGSPLSEGDRL